MLLPGLTLSDVWPAWDNLGYGYYTRDESTDDEIPPVEAYMGAHW